MEHHKTQNRVRGWIKQISGNEWWTSSLGCRDAPDLWLGSSYECSKIFQIWEDTGFDSPTMHRTICNMSSSASTVTVDLRRPAPSRLLPVHRRSCFLLRRCRMRRRERSASLIRRLEESWMGVRGEIQISGVKWRVEREWRWGDS